MSDQTTMRRVPQQARSQRRVNDILDAAEQLFVEIGYEHATTNAIATHANVPIGSLYQFFPSKEAILSALTDRYTNAMTTLFHEASWDGLPLSEAIEQFVDKLAVYNRTHAGFKMLLTASGVEDTMHTQIIQYVDETMAGRYPAFAPERRRQAALVSVAIVKGLMQLSPDVLPPAQLLAEIKTALISYLKATLQSEGLSVD